MSIEENENPWSVAYLDDFLFYCCPECDVKDQYKQSFVQHALNYHPKAKDYMGKLIIKEEFLDHHQNDILGDENDKELPKCDIIIKEEEEGDDDSKLEEPQMLTTMPNNVSEINYNYQDSTLRNVFLSNSDSNENKFNLKKERNGFTEKNPKQQRRRKNKNKSKYSAYYDKNIGTEVVEKPISEIKNNTRKTCDVCQKCVSNSTVLKYHKLAKHGIEDPSIKEQKCDICGMTFKRLFSLKSHKRIVHEKILLTCDMCKKEFTTEDSLRSHVNAVHEGIKKWTCEYCNETFGFRTGLYKHIQTNHKALEERQNYKCDICFKKFTTSHALKYHKSAIHAGIRDLICKYCNKTFGRPSCLHGHIQKVHLRNENLMKYCEFCPSSFDNLHNLKKHVSAVHKKEKPHKCEHCEKQFGVKSNLQSHIKSVHEGKRDHICASCGQAFHSATAMRRHDLSVHKGVRYKCEHCNFSSTQKEPLKKHIGSVHGLDVLDEFNQSITNKKEHERKLEMQRIDLINKHEFLKNQDTTNI